MSQGRFIGPGEVARALAQAGVEPGDLLLLHADALAAAQFPPMPQEARLDLLLESIQDYLGPRGTLALPTFTYSFTEGEDYDPAGSPSRVGMLGERFRHLPGALRSGDPLFSLTARGALAAELAQADPGDCFGPDSAFARLHRLGGKIACLGCTLQVATFLHYVERRLAVDYRYDKVFRGRVATPDGGLKECAVTYFVRDLDRQSESVLAPLTRRLEEAGLLGRASLGRVGLLCVRAADFFEQTRELLARHPTALIKEGALGQEPPADPKPGGGL